MIISYCGVCDPERSCVNEITDQKSKKSAWNTGRSRSGGETSLLLAELRALLSREENTRWISAPEIE